MRPQPPDNTDPRQADPAPITVAFWTGPELRLPARGRCHRWVNIPGRIQAPAGVYDARWKLIDRPQFQPRPLALGPTAYRLVGEGDFNIEFDPDDLRPGTNTLHLHVIDRLGRKHDATMAIHLGDEPSTGLPHRIHWRSVERIDSAAQVVDGRWTLTPDGPRTVEIGYDRVIALGDRTWTDYEVHTSFTVHARSNDPLAYGLPSCGCLVGVILRWDGHENWHDLVPYRGYKPFGAIALHVTDFGGRPERKRTRWGLYFSDDTIYPEQVGPLDRPLAPGQRHMLRASVASEADGPSLYRLKAWPAEEPEPARWEIEHRGIPGERTHGALALVAHHSDVTFGDIEILPLPRSRSPQPGT